MKKIKITVTQEDIKKGKREDCKRCAVALALRRTFNTKNIKVYHSDCFIEKYTYILPSKAKEFIDNFDLGLAVKPFSFYIKRYKDEYSSQ